MTRFTPHTTNFSLFLLDKNTPRYRNDPRAERDEPDRQPPVWRLPQPLPHAHQEHEINIVTTGTCRYVWTHKGQTHITPVSVGEMFLIPGGVEHIVEVDRFATVRGLWIHPDVVSPLPGRAMPDVTALQSFDAPLPPRLVVSEAQNAVSQEIFEQAQAEYARADDPWQIETLRVLGRLAAILFARLLLSPQKTAPLAGRSPGEVRVSVVKAFLDRNYMSDIPLGEMADMACLSSSQFSLLFRKQTGQSPKAYLLNRRLNHVATLLTNSDLSISQIAWNSGFGHLANFNHLFKTHFGLSPGEYRKKDQKERRFP